MILRSAGPLLWRTPSTDKEDNISSLLRGYLNRNHESASYTSTEASRLIAYPVRYLKYLRNERVFSKVKVISNRNQCLDTVRKQVYWHKNADQS